MEATIKVSSHGFVPLWAEIVVVEAPLPPFWGGSTRMANAAGAVARMEMITAANPAIAVADRRAKLWPMVSR